MKPSEKRALREQRLREAEERAREELLIGSEKEPEPTETYEVHTDTENQPYKRKEGFFQAHIRLITFIITATLCLTVLGPLGIDMLVASKKNKTVNDLRDIDMKTVFAVHDNADVIEWKNFRNFNYTDYSYESKDGKYLVREYPVANSRLVLKVGGSSLSARPDYIQLIDYRSGEYVNVLVDDPRDFVKTAEE